MDSSTYKVVTHTFEMSQEELGTLVQALQDVDREVYSKLPNNTQHTVKFDTLCEEFMSAYSEGKY